jgi:CheY-like chemotaxis protein
MPPTLDESAILALTGDGEHELHEAGTTLEPRHLQVLVLIDGHATVAQVRRRARDTPPDLFGKSLAELIDRGFVSAHAESPSDALDPGDFFTSGVARTVAVEPGGQVDVEAAATTEFLRQNGYYVNVARRPAAKREGLEGHKPTVLVIDDDPDICGLLRTYLKMEGFDTRSAGNREEILAELRRSPLPDLVMLDVLLPDANGFDILHKMRQHPVLKRLPTIMLTGEATREAVLKGILGGADGYITKPFDIHHMVRAVKAVLGLEHKSGGHDWDYSL